MTQESALTILKTGANVFLTGEPGAGKTHTINTYVSYLHEHSIDPAITASTGIAATHIHGQTIHSWTGIGIRRSLSPYDLDKIATTEYLVRRIKKTKVLILDEISMIDANMLDMVDAVCREVKQNEEPFGGMQVILVGDFFQLPPVTGRGEQSQFAFMAKVWKQMQLVTCYLTEQHRQEDEQLLEVLSAIRTGTFDVMHHEYLQARGHAADATPIDRSVTRLFAHNANVDLINDTELAGLVGAGKTYHMLTKGAAALVATLTKGCLSPETLSLRIGAAVMCTKNNREKEFANGTLGNVIAFESATGYPIIKVRDGRTITIEPMDWVIEEGGSIKASITQVPLRLAWAITIHKSQGMSLDAAVMDLSQVFEYGQGYVALSRVRSLAGLHLLGVNPRAFMVHPTIMEEDATFRENSYESEAAFVDLPQNVLLKMHEDFIVACGGTVVSTKEGGAKKKRDTLDVTLQFVLEQKPLSFIAKERKMTTGTIMAHVEKLVEQERVTYEQVIVLLEPSLINALPGINKTFALLDTQSLTPVFEELEGQYSYDELRLARLALSAQNYSK